MHYKEKVMSDGTKEKVYEIKDGNKYWMVCCLTFISLVYYVSFYIYNYISKGQTFAINPSGLFLQTNLYLTKA